MKNHKQSVFGAILGQAIGDAIGHPTEFAKGVVASGLPKNNRFTDDTQMMMAIAEAILAAPPQSVGYDRFMEEVSENFILWDEASFTSKNPKLVEIAKKWGENTRAPGSTCMAAVHSLASGSSWKLSGSGEQGKGNGGAMRASVVGAAFWKNLEYAFKIGGLTSVNTHCNLESILASAGVALFVASSIQGNSLAYTMAKFVDFCGEWWEHTLYWDGNVQDQSPEFAMARITNGYLLGKTKMNLTQWKNYNGNDFKGVEAVAAAMFYNTRYSNFSDIVLGLANNTGDSDTTSAIGGAIAGARYGIEMIPAEWRQNVESSIYLHDLANRIWEFSEKFELPTTTPSTDKR